MKLLHSTRDQFLFHLGRREKELLLRVLALYPRLPLAHQPLSKSASLPDQEANQRLLDEALAEHRAANHAQLRALLADPHRLQETESGWQLSLSSGDLEWLLQILNDIRVGSWVRLGSPEERLETLSPETAFDLWAMELAGMLQMLLLSALEGGGRDA